MSNKHCIVLFVFILLAGFCLAVAGCKPFRTAIKSEPASEETVGTLTEHSSRERAAWDLNQKAANFLEQNQPDAAIDLLERAIAIDPSNGPAYYYLSRAWLMKGDTQQAHEFNRLAEVYTDDDDEWHERVMEQKNHIQP